MRKFLGIVVLSAVLGAPVTASAHGVLAIADIDWSGFSYSTTPGLSLGFSDDSFGGLFGAGVADFGDLEANAAIASPLAGFSAAGFAFSITDGTATASFSSDPTDLPDSLAGPTGSLVIVGDADGPTAAPTDLVNAGLFRMLDITATGSGTATFSVPFEMSVEMSSTVFGRAQVDVSLGVADLLPGPPPGTAFIVSDATLQTLTVFSSGVDKVETYAGTLEYSIDLLDGEVFVLGTSGRVDLRSYEPVPLPAALWLMVGGCAALFGLRRKA